MNNNTFKFAMRVSKGSRLHNIITLNDFCTQKMLNKIPGTVEQVFSVQLCIS